MAAKLRASFKQPASLRAQSARDRYDSPADRDRWQIGRIRGWVELYLAKRQRHAAWRHLRVNSCAGLHDVARVQHAGRDHELDIRALTIEGIDDGRGRKNAIHLCGLGQVDSNITVRAIA